MAFGMLELLARAPLALGPKGVALSRKGPLAAGGPGLLGGVTAPGR